MTDLKPKKPEAQELQEEVAKTSKSVDSSIVDSSEASEFIDKLPGEASENSSESSSEDKKGGSGAKRDDDDSDQVVSGLAEIKIPTRRVMKQQVQNALIKQETQFLRDAKQYASHGDFFNLNEALAKVREIRLMLSELVKATFENLKSLWMKYVYNND